ncbi:hypothetical protein WOLCODRAFT_23425 [Wolfiporia cocos MD-104 SS10]|uniref:Uncharacterized protein n=1 Tax=Wolfiporia cocos (strain MD-104) TaxID=742152 RepID=A0A2H3JFE3_WOLCO|nr:hypothetical protein WOLCODRAFT_23425 [Wolfiporia cocos MD-104 SS10]
MTHHAFSHRAQPRRSVYDHAASVVSSWHPLTSASQPSAMLLANPSLASEPLNTQTMLPSAQRLASAVTSVIGSQALYGSLDGRGVSLIVPRPLMHPMGARGGHGSEGMAMFPSRLGVEMGRLLRASAYSVGHRGGEGSGGTTSRNKPG